MIRLFKEIKKKLSRAILIIVLGGFISSCIQNDINKEYYDNGSLKSELNYVDGKLSGLQKYYYPNGKIKETHILLGEGMIQYKEYGKDGDLISEGTIKNKKRIGKWSYYQNNGKLKALGMYNKDGLKEEKWEYYDHKGLSKIVFWDSFIDTSHNFMINYPKNWVVRTDIENAVLMAIPEDANEAKLKNVNFNILEIVLDEGITLEKVSSLNVSEAAKAYIDFDFTLLKEGDDKINGLDTKWYAFSIDKNNKSHIVIQFYIMVESKVFQLSFFVLKDYYSEYLPIYKEIAYSFYRLK